MADDSDETVESAIFANRGILLAIPALALVAFGRPSALSIACGLPLAFAGEFLRCWAVGYAGDTTRGNRATAPSLVTAGPYAYVRNPLYVANFLTAAGFSVAFTGGDPPVKRWALRLIGLGSMAAVYAVIVPYEESYLRATFGEEFEAYAARVPRFLPNHEPVESQQGSFDVGVIGRAESNTFLTFGAMLCALALKASKIK